ncbi:MAG TPA: prepilin peptidase [Burkholderiales bacterium]|nr:prepilin peptidase [Burkholderiales bacterium]
MTSPGAEVWVAFAVILSLACWHDARTYRIPNWLIGVGVAVAAVAHSPGFVAAGLCVGLLALLPLYAAGAAGAGDAKLLAVVGAFAGPVDAVGIATFTFVAGALIALRAMFADGPAAARTRLPYSFAIAAGSATWFGLKSTY